MNNLSTKDLNRLRSQAKIIMNRVEIFIETYLLEAPPDENLINETLQEIIKAANNLTYWNHSLISDRTPPLKNLPCTHKS